MIAILWTVIPI